MTGFAALVRLIVRRDRLALIVWVLVAGLLPSAVVAATVAGYPAEADRLAFAATALVNPAELAARGPVFAPTVGGLTAWTFTSSGTLLGGLISIVLVVRHTRADEQAGRRELIGAGVVERPAPLAAALAVVVGANLAVAAVVAAGLLTSGMAVAGSVALGLAVASGGIAFATVGAVAAQLVEGAGAARGIGIIVLGVAFALAAVGDVGGSAAIWVSPIGWARHVQAFADEQWWVLGLFVAGAAFVAAVAFALSARRDVGGGLLPARRGPSTAPPLLRSPFALAWRLHRASIAAWTAGLTMLGLLFGAAMSSLGNQLDTPAFRSFADAFGGGSVADVFFRFVLYVLAQVVAAATIASAMRMRNQEVDGLADAVLTTPVSRARWAAGHLACTAIGAVLMLAGLGLGAGIAYGTPLDVLGTTTAYVPACLVFAAIAVAATGWTPRAAGVLAWTLLAATLVIDLLGEFRLVDRAVMQLSPFVQTLQPLTIGSGLVVSLVLLVALAAALTAAGLAGLRRRDLGT
ncbi:ABC transporter permease [Pseudonocardia sp. TRM90224]|uniref:ABC transporter permease n=1 Tax=Pseudonocardia sp. TRM90224 TaxID=2812678 RepID=UPI001E37EC0F|nr:ABC transporter permease [Pseudonocardia sp. TRM90224]